MKDLKKYADLGEKRLDKHPGYQMTFEEINSVFESIIDTNDLFRAFTMIYAAGIERGCRMQKRHKNG